MQIADVEEVDLGGARSQQRSQFEDGVASEFKKSYGHIFSDLIMDEVFGQGEKWDARWLHEKVKNAVNHKVNNNGVTIKVVIS